MVFVGWCSTLPWVPRLADLYGRKKLYHLGMFLDLLILVAMFFNTSLDVMIFLGYLFGLVCTLRVNIGFVYMTEFMPKRYLAFYATMYNIFETLISLFAAIYYWLITKHW